MKKLLLALMLIPSLAGAANWNQDCNGQAQSVDACRPDQAGQSGVFFGFWMADSEAARVRDVLSEHFGYRGTVQCTQERVDAGQCAAGDIGIDFPNPESKRDFVDRKLRQQIRRFIQTRERDQAVNAIVKSPVEIDGKEDSDDEGPELD